MYLTYDYAYVCTRNTGCARHTCTELSLWLKNDIKLSFQQGVWPNSCKNSIQKLLSWNVTAFLLEPLTIFADQLSGIQKRGTHTESVTAPRDLLAGFWKSFKHCFRKLSKWKLVMFPLDAGRIVATIDQMLWWQQKRQQSSLFTCWHTAMVGMISLDSLECMMAATCTWTFTSVVTAPGALSWMWTVPGEHVLLLTVSQWQWPAYRIWASPPCIAFKWHS